MRLHRRCGVTLTCGPCAEGSVCDEASLQCISACVPLTCADLGVQCGSHDDGCGGKAECGDTCTGLPNSFCTEEGFRDCAPLDCATVGSCGEELQDGCGKTIDCPCGRKARPKAVRAPVAG